MLITIWNFIITFVSHIRSLASSWAKSERLCQGYFEVVTELIDYRLVYYDSFAVCYEMFCIYGQLHHV